MKVKYTGISDFQEFGAEDFKKAGVEQRKLSFARGEVVEVDDAVGEALTSTDADESIFWDFSFEQVEDDEESDASAEELKAERKAAKKAAAPQGSDSSGGATGTTGRGSSTGGSTGSSGRGSTR